MEEKSRKGGKRVGSGRKPLGNKKKKTICLFVEEFKIWPWGNEEKLKNSLYDYINAGVVPVIKDLNRTTNEIKPFEQPKSNFDVNVPPKQEMPKISSYEVYRVSIQRSSNADELKAVVDDFNADTNLASWQKKNLDIFAKERGKQDDFYND